MEDDKGTYCTGVGGGPPLVLIHALAVNSDMWAWQVPALAERYRVIAYDVRGHGRTPYRGEKASIQDLSGDLLALLDHLQIEQAAVVGISMGGVIAQAFAIAHPSRLAALGLVSTACRYGEEARKSQRERADLAEREGMSPLVEPTIQRWFTGEFLARAAASRQSATAVRDPENNEATLVAAIGGMIAHTDPRGYAAAARALAEVDLTPDLRRIAAPTLILSGDRDPGVSGESQQVLKEGILNSVQEVVRNASHMVPVERAAEFSTRLLSFLSSCGYV